MSLKIRLSKSSISSKEKRAVMKVLEKEYLGMGTEVKKFETNLNSYLSKSKSFVACVNSGTAALQLSLQAIGIKKNDKVLVPSLNFVSGIQAISATGATPVFCDVLKENFTIDPMDIKKKLSKKIKAIMPVHYAGASADMDSINKIAKSNNIFVIEDSAHALGSFDYKNNLIGTGENLSCFSFDGIKNITSGEGGAIFTKNKALYEKVCDYRLLGVHKDTLKRYKNTRSWDFDVFEQGWRYHMSNINAAIGIEQLKRIEMFKKKRQSISRRYIRGLSGISEIKFLKIDYSKIMAHIFVIRVLDGSRDQLKSYLMKKNIETGIHWKPAHLLNKYKNNISLKNTELLYNEMISLPCHVDLSIRHIDYIIQEMKKFFLNKK